MEALTYTTRQRVRGIQSREHGEHPQDIEGIYMYILKRRGEKSAKPIHAEQKNYIVEQSATLQYESLFVYCKIDEKVHTVRSTIIGNAVCCVQLVKIRP